MIKLKIATILLSAFFLFSCNDKAKKDGAVTPEMETHVNSNAEAIQLNNGKKWKVDDNMMVLIRTMEKEVASSENQKPENYQMLIDSLAKNIDLLTSNCTMKGQAHDELHKWLLPFIDLVKAFSKEKSTENFTEIQHSFLTFNTYFE